MNAILRFFCDRGVAYIGEDAYKMEKLVNKWDHISTVVEELFDDDLTWSNHSMSLALQNDSRVWKAMEDLFKRTKEQGKTQKSNQRKIDYFRSGFSKIIRQNPQIVQECKKDTEDFYYDDSLCSWWINYYFNEHDAEMHCQVPLYSITQGYAAIIQRAKVMERRMKGKRTEPKFTLPCSEIKLEIQARDDCWVSFEWKEMDYGEACKLMGLCKYGMSTWNNGQPWDYSGSLNKKLRKMFPHAHIDSMDTPNAMNGENNNWFYIYFHWKPEHFSWAQVLKAEQAVRKLILPHIKKPYLPMGVEEKYQVVSLQF